MHLRKPLLQPGNKVEKIFERKIGMQSSNNVKLGDRLGISRTRDLKRLFERHRVSARSVFLPSKRTQAASGHANIRRIDMAIHVEVRGVAVHALANPIRQPAHREDVAGTVEGERVGVVQALAGEDFVLDGRKSGVVGLE